MNQQDDPELSLWRHILQRRVASGQIGLGAVPVLFSLAGLIFHFRLFALHGETPNEYWPALLSLCIGPLIAGIALSGHGLTTAKHGIDPEAPDVLADAVTLVDP